MQKCTRVDELCWTYNYTELFDKLFQQPRWTLLSCQGYHRKEIIPHQLFLPLMDISGTSCGVCIPYCIPYESTSSTDKQAGKNYKYPAQYSLRCCMAYIINQHIHLFYTTKLHMEIALYNTLSIDLGSHCSQQQEESQDLDILFQISLGWSIAVLRRQQAPKTYGLVETEDTGTWSLPGRNLKICFRTGIEGRFYSRTRSNNKIQTHC